MQAHRKAIVSVLFIAAGAIAAQAAAQGLGGGLSIGMPGPPPEVPITERFGIRGAFSSGTPWYDHDEAVTQYDGKFPIGAGFLLADWHPYANGFRLSGGLAYNNQRVDGSGRVTPRSAGSALHINAGSFAAPVGLLDTRARSARATPYLGVGWGLTPRAGSRLYFSADLGVMYQRPSASLAGACSAALSASMCAQLQSDIRDESEYREATDDFRFYPVISVGFGLRF